MQEKVPAASRRRGASGRAVKMEAWFLRKLAQASRAACQPMGKLTSCPRQAEMFASALPWRRGYLRHSGLIHIFLGQDGG
jgi:hypothetical protein